MERDTEVRLTVLTVLILLLIGLLIVYTGVQAVSTERRFFRGLTFEANSAVSKMVAREFLQVFTNTTGWVESMARFPGVQNRQAAESKRLFEVMLSSHPSIRVLYLLDPDGKTVVRAVRSEDDYRPLGPDQIAYFTKGRSNHLLTQPYFVDPTNRQGSSLAITYAVRVEDPKRAFGGILATEVSLQFIQDILGAVRIGQTGQILVIARPKAIGVEVLDSQAATRRETMPEVIYTSSGVTAQDITDLQRNFPIDLAYGDVNSQHTGFEYEATMPKMASYARLQLVGVGKAGGPVVTTALPVSISPSRCPDWLIVVQQAAEEGYMVADRLKYNVIMLVIVGLGGLGIIAKLWTDSINA